MKRKLLILVFVIIGFVPAKLDAQSIIIETHSGELTYEKLDSIQYLSFPYNNMVVDMVDNSTRSFSLLSLKKIYFDLTTGTDEFESSGTEMVLYPNPVTNILKISNVPVNETPVTIFSLQGANVLQTEISSFYNEINVTHLPKGLYFIRISGQTLKFIKQ